MNNLIPTEKDWKRFWDKVEKTNGCWEWKAAKNKAGYGQFGFGPNLKTRSATRFVVTFIKNIKLTNHDVVCHHCDNPGCVNPDHLWVGTQKQNIQDASRKGRMFTGSRTIRDPKDIDFILNYYKTSKNKTQALAYLREKFSISIGSVQSIIYKK